MARGRSVRSARSARNNSLSMKGVSAETVVIVVLLIVLLVLVVYYVRQNSEGFESAEKCNIFIFVADWCPHCKNAASAFDNLKQNAPNNVNVNIVNEADGNSRELMSKYNVRGFPTCIKVNEDGSVVEFDKRPTAENLLEFANGN